MSETNEGVAGKSRPSPFRNRMIFKGEPIVLPYNLVTEHELAHLSNEVLAEYPGASDEFLEMVLRERVLEFAELQRWKEQEWGQVDDCDGVDLDDYEGPNHPCTYCYVSLCADCKRFEHSKAMQEVIAEGGDPVKAFPDLTEEERRSLR